MSISFSMTETVRLWILLIPESEYVAYSSTKNIDICEKEI